mgnify:CR=1 FL=1|jgi:hypothetical protein
MSFSERKGRLSDIVSEVSKERIIKYVLGDPLGAKRFLSHRMRYCCSF